MDYPKMTSRQSMASAKVSGAAELWAIGRYRDRPRSEALAALAEITADPVSLGDALGTYLTTSTPATSGLSRSWTSSEPRGRTGP